MALFPDEPDQTAPPPGATSQGYRQKVEELADTIMGSFRLNLPSNYASEVTGPAYTVQFRAAAVELAKIQIEAQLAFGDADPGLTRPEFLYQIIGALMFPDGDQNGIPKISGDVTYRAFMARMVRLLLRGATEEALEEAVQAMAGEESTVRESGDPHTFDIDILIEGGTKFASDPVQLEQNLRLVVRALKPAHTLYRYRNLFLETLGTDWGETVQYGIQDYNYEDTRRYHPGAVAITSASGEVDTDRSLLHDPTLDFEGVRVGTWVEIESGGNTGRYRVVEVLRYPVGDDATAYTYTTSSGLTGKATVTNGAFQDLSQNFDQAREGETLTLAAGPNKGTYLLRVLLGSAGGPLKPASGYGGTVTRVRPAYGFLRVTPRFPEAGVTGVTYRVGLDRLGVRSPSVVEAEDVSHFFHL